jgi:hypothetical protein
MQYFYDGQIRRYITQIVRAFSKFSYKDADGDLREVPVMYGDITRQVASIIRDNSENKLPSAPRMGVYITGFQMDRSRLSDSSYVSKINLRERAYDTATGEYSTEQAKGYTVERLHPTPYTLSVNVDVWSTSTDQKLQILEQIFMLFNPDLEFQTTDNYIDWTSLSVLQLENINFSNRTIPTGTETEIDVATLGFTAPVYISPPVKVKKLGIITDIITSIFNQDAGTISLEGFNPSTDNNVGAASGVTVLPDGTLVNEDGIRLNTIVATGQDGRFDLNNPIVVSYRNFDLIVEDETGKIAKNRSLRVGDISWLNILEAELPARYQPGISQLRLKRAELINEIVGTFTLNADNDKLIDIIWDVDTLPSDTIIEGPVTTSGSINKIINPKVFNPSTKTAGYRLLTLDPIGFKVERRFTVETASTRIDTDIDYYVAESASGSTPGRRADTVTSWQVVINDIPVSSTSRNIDDKFVIDLDEMPSVDDKIVYILNLNEDGADAWKNLDNSDFVADANDIIEWDGSKWNIVFDASESGKTYITNLDNGQQYYWNQYYWQSSVDGYYPRGTWRIQL